MKSLFKRALFNLSRSGWYSLAVLILTSVYGLGSAQSILLLFPLQVIIVADFGISAYSARHGKLASHFVIAGFALGATAIATWIFWGALKLQFGEDLGLDFFVFCATVFLGSCAFTLNNSIDAFGRSSGKVLPNLGNKDQIMLLGLLTMVLVLAIQFAVIGVIFAFFIYQIIQLAIIQRRLKIESGSLNWPELLAYTSTASIFMITAMFAIAGPRLDLALMAQGSAPEAFLIYFDFVEKCLIFIGMPIGVWMHVRHAQKRMFVASKLYWLATALGSVMAVLLLYMLTLNADVEDLWVWALFVAPYILIRLSLMVAVFELVNCIKMQAAISLSLVLYFALAFALKTAELVDVLGAVWLSLAGLLMALLAIFRARYDLVPSLNHDSSAAPSILR